MISEWYKTKRPVKLNRPKEEIAQPQVKKYDAVIAGAGPAGACAAFFMAREGLDVLLLERGPFPGSKNCGGAAIIAEHVHKLFPNFWEELECERIVTSLGYWWLTEDSAVSVGYNSTRLAAAPFNRITIKRSKLYSWLIGKAVAAGATIKFSQTVTEILFGGEQAYGVKTAEPQATTYLADVVILADGANSLLAEKAGLAPPATSANLSLYVKETIALPSDTIEDRFNLHPGQGTIIGLVGHPTAGFNGTASIHTFKDSLNINAGMSVASFVQGGINPADLMPRIKNHPVLRPLLEGGVVTEYGAAMIPEGGYNAIPELVHPGLLIVGDAGSLVNGTHGINLAMWSGFFAAKAANSAKKSRDFSRRGLSLYRTLLDESFVLQNMRSNAKAARLQQDLPYLFDLYSRMANETAYHISQVYTMPIKDKRKFVWRKITSMQPLSKILSDAWKVLKVVRG